MADQQKGFTLVELMVAMTIGTVIILGAGQLFLTTFQTFRTVDALSRKQESLIFAASTLSNSIREGEEEVINDYGIKLNERISNGVTQYYCVLQYIEDDEPLVDLARIDPNTPCPVLSSLNGDDVSHTLTLLVGDCRKESSKTGCDEITFKVTDRNKIISNQEMAP
ncbi:MULTISPECIES: prepilin-type N-terminal cleavage/methylation domain-containing protein [Halomonadaceae]|uniref:Prepilin-type N-terminal cleavage/methylation domain-containing protein n=2 Tax=Vreelandella TaxID=3137766 RepID=A0A7Z0LX91_9GAMM|nr:MULTISPECIES: prepilin-type N-terminal cleavage/methylation domain-containing protein [Halomonas]NYS80284.1 prepilin-type N-terminal cleavage/methylation domain-containing protein [Halomonas glaciei]